MQAIIPFRASVPIEKPESVYVEQEDGSVIANWRGLLEAIENKKTIEKVFYRRTQINEYGY